MLFSGVVSDVALRLAIYLRRDQFAFNHRSRCIAESRVELHLSGSYEHSDGPRHCAQHKLNLTLGIAGNTSR